MRAQALVLAVLVMAPACGRTPQSWSGGGAPVRPTAAPVEPATVISGIVVGEGADPDWRLVLDAENGVVRLRAPRVRAPASADVDIAMAVNGGMVYTAGETRVFLRAEPCTPAAGGVAYPMSAEVRVGAAPPLTGCAYARWDNALDVLMPAIEACMAASPARGAVPYAAFQPDGAAIVRIDAARGRFECVLTPDGVARVRPLKAPPPYAGEGDPAFRLAADGPAPGCRGAHPVRDAAGRVVGHAAPPGAC